MSRTKLDTSGVFESVEIQSQLTQLSVTPQAVRIRRSGIEFRAQNPIPTWTEMTVDLVSTLDGTKLNFTGVVVACHGNRHGGYLVSMIFINLPPQVQEHLDLLAFSRIS